MFDTIKTASVLFFLAANRNLGERPEICVLQVWMQVHDEDSGVAAEGRLRRRGGKPLLRVKTNNSVLSALHMGTT